MKCQWIGNGESCEHESVENRSYCEQHLWRVYQKGTALGKRKKDIRRAQSVWDLQSAINEAVAELEQEGFDFNESRWELEET